MGEPTQFLRMKAWWVPGNSAGREKRKGTWKNQAPLKCGSNFMWSD